MENNIFEKMPVPKAFFKMALPVVLSMVVGLVYNMVDTWFIARTQDTNLVAGVSLCAPIITLMVAMGDVFGIGGSSLIARLFGEKELEKAKKVSAFCFYGTIAFGIVAAILLLVFKTPVLHLLGAKTETMEYASSYYTWLALGTPAMILAIVPNNLLRTEGMAAQAMIGTIIGSLINIVLDPIFIFTLQMGAGGAALATVLSNAISVVIFVIIILKKSEKLSLSFRDMIVSKREIIAVFSIGFPACITNLMQSFAIMLTNRYLVAYGNDKVAALGIALKLNLIVMLIMVGFAFGAQPLLGYNYGAKNHKRLKELVKFDIMVQVVFSIVAATIFWIIAPQIIHVFMKSQEVVSAGSLILRCLMITAPFMGIILVLTTLFQAAGKALPALILSISRQGIVLLLCMVILAKAFGYYGVVCAQAAADVITMLIAIFLAVKCLGFGRKEEEN